MNNIAAIGHNQPPGAIELAGPAIEVLRAFLADNPVIGNEDEARKAKAILDRTIAALKGIDDERKSKVDPLNAQVKEVNTSYHKWHNAGIKSGIWDKLLAELRSRMTAFARAEEVRRIAAAEAARKAAEEAERKAREAEVREREAAEDAALGVCTDIAAATQEADDAFAQFKRASREAQRAERDSHVRIGGGFGRVSTLRNKEILTVTAWKAAIEEMADDEGRIPGNIADAILIAARAHRKAFDRLPAGISQSFDRSL